MTLARPAAAVNSPAQVLFASLIGTTIEFFDFYIYATAAVLVFPRLFFPTSDPTASNLASLATFAIAFFARPLGSALFGHFGDRVGRKTTLVAALLTMGISTVVIGLLPTYASIGVAAPILLALCRFGQGLGLGGEWGGAVLLAVENAPPGKRAWYGMFPQLGAPIGFFFSGGIFLVLSKWLTDAQFFCVRLAYPLPCERRPGAGGPVRAADDHRDAGVHRSLGAARARRGPDVRRLSTLPAAVAARHGGRARHVRAVLSDDGLRALVGDHATRLLAAGLPAHPALRRVCSLRSRFRCRRVYADSHGRRRTLLVVSAAIAAFGFVFAPLFVSGTIGAVVFLTIGLALMGLTYGPIGTILSELFPTSVRYTGSSLTFNGAGIFGASLAPYIATELATRFGLQAVGYYLTGAAVISFIALLGIHETKDKGL